MPIEYITILVCLAVVVLLALGLPIAFCLMGSAVMFTLIFLKPQALYLVVTAVFGQMRSEILVAIPLFIFMSTILEASGVGEGLYDAMYKWIGRLKGGLSIGTVLICTMIAAITGLGGTGVILMGLLALPEMRKRNYSKSMSLGPIVSGGALGPLIPPSALMILLGAYAQLSVGKLFMAGLFPGIIMSALFCLYIGIMAYLRPQTAPALPEELRATWGERLSSLRYIILPIILIIVVLGSIYTGMCTPTEAAGFGAFGALICAAINRRLNWGNLKKAVISCFGISVMVIWLIFGGWVFAAFLGTAGVRDFVAGMLIALPIGSFGVMLVMLAVALIMGMFLDGGAIVVICIPIFMPAIRAMGIDPLWFGLLFIVALIAGYITPPFGFNIFYLKGITPPDITMGDIYRSALPYIILMIITLIVCIAFPPLSMWLPGTM